MADGAVKWVRGLAKPCGYRLPKDLASRQALEHGIETGRGCTTN